MLARSRSDGRRAGNSKLANLLGRRFHRTLDCAGFRRGDLFRFAAAQQEPAMIYQLGWTTLPGLRGLSCSEFRATPTAATDNESGVAVQVPDRILHTVLLRA